MRIIGLMVTKNESARYLAPVLSWAEKFLDDLFVMDDQSTDNTPAVVAEFGAVVAVRPDGLPSFIDHEGMFRQLAWDTMTHAARPSTADWIFALDADEFLTPVDDSNPYVAVREDALQAIENEKFCSFQDHMLSVGFHVPEVFDASDGVKVRTDGYWDKIYQTRMCRWEPGQRFANKPMASGSLPIRATHGGVSHRCKILHFGYANPDDRKVKYARYSNRSGHATKHVDSIVTTPKLREWEGVNPLAP